MNIIDVLQLFFKEHPEYDGLVDTEEECGCPKDDLMPCGELCTNCELGHNTGPQQGYDNFIEPGPKQVILKVSQVCDRMGMGRLDRGYCASCDDRECREAKEAAKRGLEDGHED